MTATDDESQFRRFSAKDKAGTRKDPGESRTRTQQDRDRILYSRAFHRLAGITQVVSPTLGHPFHNRMIHSLKVAQVGRRIAEQMIDTGVAKPDIDAVEAACLAHDLGHPPFGHSTEVLLNDLAKTADPPFEGFEGNAQSFRIIAALEPRKPLPNHRACDLDLCRITLAATLKYPWLINEWPTGKESKWGAYDSESPQLEFAREGAAGTEQTIEAAIMDWADDVTYAVHDTMDFYRAGLIPLATMNNTNVRRDFISARGDKVKGSLGEYQSVDEVLDDLLLGPIRLSAYDGSRYSHAQLVQATSSLISLFVKPEVFEETSAPGFTVKPNVRAQVEVLKELTRHFVIDRPELATVQAGQQRVIRDLFAEYHDASSDEKKFRLFPPDARDSFPAEGPARTQAVVDFIASLTEDMAYTLHARLAGDRNAIASSTSKFLS